MLTLTVSILNGQGYIGYNETQLRERIAEFLEFPLIEPGATDKGDKYLLNHNGKDELKEYYYLNERGLIYQALYIPLSNDAAVSFISALYKSESQKLVRTGEWHSYYETGYIRTKLIMVTDSEWPLIRMDVVYYKD